MRTGQSRLFHCLNGGPHNSRHDQSNEGVRATQRHKEPPFQHQRLYLWLHLDWKRHNYPSAWRLYSEDPVQKDIERKVLGFSQELPTAIPAPFSFFFLLLSSLPSSPSSSSSVKTMHAICGTQVFRWWSGVARHDLELQGPCNCHTSLCDFSHGKLEQISRGKTAGETWGETWVKWSDDKRPDPCSGLNNVGFLMSQKQCILFLFV